MKSGEIYRKIDNQNAEYDMVILTSKSGAGLWNCEWLDIDKYKTGKHVFLSDGELSNNYEKIA